MKYPDKYGFCFLFRSNTGQGPHGAVVFNHWAARLDQLLCPLVLERGQYLDHLAAIEYFENFFRHFFLPYNRAKVQRKGEGSYEVLPCVSRVSILVLCNKAGKIVIQGLKDLNGLQSIQDNYLKKNTMSFNNDNLSPGQLS